MKTMNIKYVLIAFLATWMIACKKDFVDVRNPNQVPTTQFGNKPEDAMALLIPCYATMKFNGTFGNTMQVVFYGMDPNVCNEGQGYTPYSSMVFFTDDSKIRGMYQQFYAGLNRCANAFKVLPKCFANSTSAKELADYRAMIGEVYFLRALHSYYITTLFNNPPLITKILPTFDYKKLTNTDQKIWFDTIVSDCRNAMARLPLAWKSDSVGRATKGAAIALLGKTFMNMQEWDSAKKYFDMLIVDKVGNYDLIQPQGNDSLDYVYAYLCNYSIYDLKNGSKVYPAENNKESIFELQNAEEGSTFWNLFLNGYGCDGSLVNTWFSIVGYWNVGVTNTFMAKFEKVTPTASNPLHYDARKYCTGYQPGDYIRCWDNSNPWCDWPIDRIFTGFDSKGDSTFMSKLVKAWNVPGVTIKKYMFPLYPFTQANNKTDPNNWRLITYSDVLLYAAETEYQLGNDVTALIYVNQIRRRAGLPDTSGTGTALKNIIIHEREMEKGIEGSWMLEVMRWARTKDKRTGEARFVDPTTIKPGFKLNKNEYLPIPQYEIDYLIDAGLTQNPGW